MCYSNGLSIFGVCEYLMGSARLHCHSPATRENGGSKLTWAAGTDPESLHSKIEFVSALPLFRTWGRCKDNPPKKAHRLGKVLVHPQQWHNGSWYQCQVVECLLTTDQLNPSMLTHHAVSNANSAANLRKVKAPAPLTLTGFFSLTLTGQAGDLPFFLLPNFAEGEARGWLLWHLIWW